jgi:hypothetical protein
LVLSVAIDSLFSDITVPDKLWKLIRGLNVIMKLSYLADLSLLQVYRGALEVPAAVEPKIYLEVI